jgi:hypothetical protein
VPAQSSFDYAIVRLVPHVEREEFINVGVILFCRTRRCLIARFGVDPQRLAILAPAIDLATVQAHLELIARICAGGPEAGPFSEMSQAERFHWLVSPRSTAIQVSPVHVGLCTDPEAALADLFNRLVDCPAVARKSTEA